MPWYTTAIGTAGGILGAKKLAPKKWAVPAELAGALLGTGLGLQAGKAVGKKLKKEANVVVMRGPGNRKFSPDEAEFVRFMAETRPTRIRSFGGGGRGSARRLRESIISMGGTAPMSLMPMRYQAAKFQQSMQSRMSPFGMSPSAMMGGYSKLGMAKQAARKEKTPHPAETAAKGLAGFGLGGTAGYLGMKGLEHLLGPGSLHPAARIGIPVATGALGLAYPYFQQKMLGKMREDHLKRQEEKRKKRDRSSARD